MTAPPPTLAVVAARFTRLFLLQRLLEQSHPHVIAHLTDQLPAALPRLRHFLEEHQPWLVVYDLAAPYDQSWTVYDQVRATDRGRRQYLVTVEQPAALSPALQQAGVVAVASRVPDLVELLHCVRVLLTRPQPYA